MVYKTISEIQQEYELELDRIVLEIKNLQADQKSKNKKISAIKEIENNKARKILLQFPDGMKPYSSVIVDYLEEKTGKGFFIWLGSCYGACDVPKVSGFGLVIQFGHSEWIKN